MARYILNVPCRRTQSKGKAAKKSGASIAVGTFDLTHSPAYTGRCCGVRPHRPSSMTVETFSSCLRKTAATQPAQNRSIGHRGATRIRQKTRRDHPFDFLHVRQALAPRSWGRQKAKRPFNGQTRFSTPFDLVFCKRGSESRSKALFCPGMSKISWKSRAGETFRRHKDAMRKAGAARMARYLIRTVSFRPPETDPLVLDHAAEAAVGPVRKSARLPQAANAPQRMLHREQPAAQRRSAS